MRPGMIIFIPLLALIICLSYITCNVFRGCTTVNEIFGNELTQTMLADKYFYDQKNGTIGKKVGEDNYYTIFQNRIDSLNWNTEIIVGFVDKFYFAITVEPDRQEWPITRDSVKTLSLKYRGVNMQALHNVPGLKEF
jgi:hypothetical protein